MPTWSVSTGRYDTSGCHNTSGKTWHSFKTSPPNGCGLTTMTDPTWPWADSHQSSDWPWLRNVSTSQTPAKGDDYPTANQIQIDKINKLIDNKNLAIAHYKDNQDINEFVYFEDFVLRINKSEIDL